MATTSANIHVTPQRTNSNYNINERNLLKKTCFLNHTLYEQISERSLGLRDYTDVPEDLRDHFCQEFSLYMKKKTYYIVFVAFHIGILH